MECLKRARYLKVEVSKDIEGIFIKRLVKNLKEVNLERRLSNYISLERADSIIVIFN